MPSFNKVILAGNITRDPELSFTASKMEIVKFGLAVNEKRKDSEKTHFVDCVSFGKTGETISKYCKKGSPLLVEGRLNHQTWEAQDGSRRSKLEVVVDNFQFLGSKQESNSEDKPF